MKRDVITEMPPFVAFIDGAAEGWEARVRQCLEDGQNFFVLIAPGREGARRLDELSVPSLTTNAGPLATAGAWAEGRSQ